MLKAVADAVGLAGSYCVPQVLKWMPKFTEVLKTQICWNKKSGCGLAIVVLQAKGEPEAEAAQHLNRFLRASAND
jgi:hypothetical protein